MMVKVRSGQKKQTKVNQEIVERYDDGEGEEWPEETDESESSSEHRDSFSIARIKENRKSG